MKWIKKIIILFTVGIVGIVSYDIGSIAKTRHWFANNLLVVPHTESKETELSPILNQKFTYLTKGSTCRVFVSEDDKYVLKLFLEKSYASHSWWKKAIPPLAKLSEKRKTLKMKKEKFIGCMNAYHLLPEETGMIYFHFAPTNFFKQALTIIDEKGEEKRVNLDNSDFFIQKKAEVTFAYIDMCKEKHQFEKAKLAIHNLLDFTTNLYEQGIVMVDLQFMSNFGFIDDKPLRIDVEHLHFNPAWKIEHKEHLEKELKEFHQWLEKNHPELL